MTPTIHAATKIFPIINASLSEGLFCYMRSCNLVCLRGRYGFLKSNSNSEDYPFGSILVTITVSKLHDGRITIWKSRCDVEIIQVDELCFRVEAVLHNSIRPRFSGKEPDLVINQ